MRFDVLTLFPDMVAHAARHGVTGKAIETGRVKLGLWNPRSFTRDRHQSVDDRPYGGGPGMVMKYQPLRDALRAAKQQDETGQERGIAKTIYLSPQGRPLTQPLLMEASAWQRLILIAGRYEGVDERFIERHCDDEWSIGDYVISGGELAALIVIDGVTRLLPGVLGDENSAKQDSHAEGLLDYPHFTRPRQLTDAAAAMAVPAVLTSGNHAAVERWRRKQALGRTWLRRPDLLKQKELNAEQKALLNEYLAELN